MRVVHRKGIILDTPFRSVKKLHGKRCSLVEVGVEEIFGEPFSDELLGKAVRLCLGQLEPDGGQLIISSSPLVGANLHG